MSTLRVGTISNAAGSQSTSAENVINGSAKAWVNFNGTGTVAIRASYNVTSITDNGVGDYTVNFTTAMVDANFSASCSAVQSTSTNIAMRPFPFGNYGAGSFRVRTADTGNNVAVDADTCFVAIFR